MERKHFADHNPVIAALLNAFLLVLGYVYLGQGKRATVVFGIIIVLWKISWSTFL